MLVMGLHLPDPATLQTAKPLKYHIVCYHTTINSVRYYTPLFEGGPTARNPSTKSRPTIIASCRQGENSGTNIELHINDLLILIGQTNIAAFVGDPNYAWFRARTYYTTYDITTATPAQVATTIFYVRVARWRLPVLRKRCEQQ